MHIYNVRDLAEEQGEYILGSAVLKTHACYLVYGRLKEKEKERMVKPGKGHEEIFCLRESFEIKSIPIEFKLLKDTEFRVKYQGNNTLKYNPRIESFEIVSEDLYKFN